MSKLDAHPALSWLIAECMEGRAPLSVCLSMMHLYMSRGLISRHKFKSLRGQVLAARKGRQPGQEVTACAGHRQQD